MKKLLSIFLVLVSVPTFSAELYLACVGEPNFIEVMLDRDNDKASVTMNKRVAHACELSKTAELYMLKCPSLGNPSLDRQSLVFCLNDPILGCMEHTCEIIEKAEPKI